MTPVKKTTPKNILNRSIRFAKWVRDSATASVKDGKPVYFKDNPIIDEACANFDKMLDDLLENDFFGTEGQCDPRGDRRG